MKQFSNKTLVVGPTIGLLVFGLLACTSATASAGSSFAYSGGKQAYDQKIANAAANLAAEKIDKKLRGTFTNIDQDAFVSEEILENWQNG